MGVYYFLATVFPPTMRKKTYVTDKKPDVPLGLKDTVSRRIYNPEPIRNKFYWHQGRVGPHTKYLQMESGVVTKESLFKCETCNMAMSKKAIDQHVRTYAYKHTL